MISGYYEVDVGLPDSPGGMRIMGIADVNNDKLNDLITVDSTAQQVTIYYYNDASFKFDTASTFDVENGWTINSIIPFTATSGLADLILVVSKYSQGSLQTKLQYCKQEQSGSSESGTEYHTWKIEQNQLSDTMIQPGSQPMTLDVNGDQSMDLLYELAGNGGIKVSLGSRADPSKWEQ